MSWEAAGQMTPVASTARVRAHSHFTESAHIACQECSQRNLLAESANHSAISIDREQIQRLNRLRNHEINYLATRWAVFALQTGLNVIISSRIVVLLHRLPAPYFWAVDVMITTF